MVIARLTGLASAPARWIARVVGAIALTVLVLVGGDIGPSSGIAAVRDPGASTSAGVRASLTYGYDVAPSYALVRSTEASTPSGAATADDGAGSALVWAGPSPNASVVAAETEAAVEG